MTDRDTGLDSVDVVVVGDGPSEYATAVFTAWYSLDTVVFDWGNAALRWYAYLESYLGSLTSVGVNTFTALIHEHLVEVGADHVTNMVVSVE